MTSNEAKVRQDLNNPVFQGNLLTPKSPSAMPPPGIDTIYSLRISQALRATAYRDGEFIRFLSVEPDHDSTYGTK